MLNRTRAKDAALALALATLNRKSDVEATIRRELSPDLDTAKQLLETAWPHCGAIQDVIDRLNETGSNTELRLLANRLQRLIFRVRPVPPK